MAKKITVSEDQEKNGLIPSTTDTDGDKVTDSEKEIPLHISGILKKKPMYEFLFIDSCGGCFTEDTPANIRKNAALYKNPFHNNNTDR